MADHSPSFLQTLSSALENLVRAAAPSVVSVLSQRAQSSGFSWGSGLIVAAESALSDDGEISIVARDGATGAAQLVGRDPTTDIALLRVERTDLPYAFAPVENPTTGALALVVGAREGGPTASLGAVSFVGPKWRSLRGGLIDARIELDATLRRSSEGGLALDANGRAFGMVVFGPRRRALVIPMATIHRVAELLAAKGRVARGYLGLGLQPVKLESGGMGAMAISVDPKGPGASAGVRQGDVIIAWDGEAIRGVHHLMRSLGPDRVGSSVTFSLLRAGEPLELKLTIGERPESQ